MDQAKTTAKNELMSAVKDIHSLQSQLKEYWRGIKKILEIA